MKRIEKIEQLTPEQERALVTYRAEWLAVGLATGPADLDAVRPVIADFYKRIDRPAPYLWRCESPLMAQLVISFLRANLGDNLRDNLWDNLRANLGANLRANLRDNLRGNLWANLWDNLRDNLRDNLGANLRANLGDNLRDNLWANLRDNLRGNLRANLGANLGANLRDNLRANLGDNLRDNLGANLWDNLGANLRANLRDNLGDNLRDNLGANLRDNLDYVDTWVWGSLDAYWVAYFLYPHEHLHPMHTADQLELLTGWGTIARSAFWWYPFEGVCFVCDRPTEIHKDERTRLHNPSGPSVAFSDGWRLYHVHGVAVPADIIETPASITVERIRAESNAEVRRVMIELYGQARYLIDSGAQLIHSDGYGDLYRAEVPEDEPLVMVKVINSTPEPDGSRKDYWLRVPGEMTTAEQAVAWTCGLEVGKFEFISES